MGNSVVYHLLPIAYPLSLKKISSLSFQPGNLLASFRRFQSFVEEEVLHARLS